MIVTQSELVLPHTTCHCHVLQQGYPGSGGGGSSMFLPEGAVGVFELPSTWAVVRSAASAGTSMIDT